MLPLNGPTFCDLFRYFLHDTGVLLKGWGRSDKYVARRRFLLRICSPKGRSVPLPVKNISITQPAKPGSGRQGDETPALGGGIYPPMHQFSCQKNHKDTVASNFLRCSPKDGCLYLLKRMVDRPWLRKDRRIRGTAMLPVALYKVDFGTALLDCSPHCENIPLFTVTAIAVPGQNPFSRHSPHRSGGDAQTRNAGVRGRYSLREQDRFARGQSVFFVTMVFFT